MTDSVDHLKAVVRLLGSSPGAVLLQQDSTPDR